MWVVPIAVDRPVSSGRAGGTSMSAWVVASPSPAIAESPTARSFWLLLGWLLLAFAASCATLVLELVAGRLLAPFIGVSLYTWTSIIGVILAGVSLGSWLGGRLADRRPDPRLLGQLFLLGGATTIATLGILGVLGAGNSFDSWPLLARIFLLTSLVFLPPSLVLGMVTPLVIRLALPDLQRAGRVVGLVYAAGTAGSLIGTFLTGFVLTAYFPVNQIVTAIGLLLLALGTLVIAFIAPYIKGVRLLPRGPVIGSYPLPCSPALSPGPAYAIVIIASACCMGLELAASRMLAPAVGLSLYSWTGIIGAVLAGITLGNFLGGRLADRWPNRRMLAGSLFAAGLACLSVLVSIGLTEATGLFGQLGLLERIVTLTVAIFFLPVLLLGTISPQVIRLAVSDLAHAGRVSGQIYAWSTAGAILGTFATGWLLISTFGVRTVVFAIGLILLGLAMLVSRLWRRPLALLGALILVGAVVAALGARGALTSTCTSETNYFCIQVNATVREGYQVKSLVLDHLVHSYVKIGDPSYLGYEHEYVQTELARYQVARTGRPGILVIGGGGYTFPRWVEAMMPNSTIDVVEIDPGVVAINYDELGLPRDTRIVSHALDGRQFVHELAPVGHYALVVQDAVNDLSVPYHIMTKEYNDQVKAILAPDGVYLLTVIDLYNGGQLLRSAVRTMMQTFPSVQLLAATQAWDGDDAAVWVIAGGEQPLDLEVVRSYLQSVGAGRMRTQMLAPARLRAYVDQGPQIILTDQYAPVDNLIAPLFTGRG
jgi:spermidine synthase/MFS family permease